MQIPLSLYIHIPWCQSKCPYCDFNSYAINKEPPTTDYYHQLIADLKNDLRKTAGRTINTIFIGGGTPTLIPATTIAKLLQQIAKIAPINSNAEITIEANPGTINLAKLRTLHHAGINRISIGVQSFLDKNLTTLSRIHNQQQAKQAIDDAHTAGFNNINIDLMHGLPKQTPADAVADLTTAFSLQPTHISWYQLTIENGTAFYQQPPELPDEDTLYAIQSQGEKTLAAHGFIQYEISAYCQTQYECQHNLNYWCFGDYLGIGAGAHGKISNLAANKIIRLQKFSHPKIYLQQAHNFIAETIKLNQNDLISEFMLNALRLYYPIAIELFSKHTGLKLKTIQKKLLQATAEGFINFERGYIATTSKGKQYLNNLLQIF